MTVPIINAPATSAGPQIHAVATPAEPGGRCGVWLYEVNGGFISREMRLSRDAAEALWRCMMDAPTLRFLGIAPNRGQAIHLALDGALRTFEAAEALAQRADGRADL